MRLPGLVGGIGGTRLDHTADPRMARIRSFTRDGHVPFGTRRGANEHLVRPSRCGAPVRPTIAAAISGRVGHSQFGLPSAVLALRRNATFGNYLGRRSRIAERPSVHLMTVRAPRIPVAITSRVTTDHSASRPDPRYGRAHRSTSFRAPSVASRVSGGRSPRLGPMAQAERPRPTSATVALATWSRREICRASRSSWTTRAAATSSGSRVTVRASQSMYDGSKAATWPSVWP
jgi:hypothetical protein